MCLRVANYKEGSERALTIENASQEITIKALGKAQEEIVELKQEIQRLVTGAQTDRNDLIKVWEYSTVFISISNHRCSYLLSCAGEPRDY